MFKSLAEHAPCSIWICDEDGTIIFANPAALALFGVTEPSEIIGRYNIHRDTTEAEKPLLAYFERARAGEVVRYRQDLDMTTVKYATKRREILHFQSTLFAFPAGNSRRPHIVVMQEDITELVRAGEALRESEERYRDLYNKTPAMLHSIDGNRRLLNVSNAWLETLGYEREEVLGRKPTEFLAEDSRRDVEDFIMPEFFERGYANDVPLQFVKKNGETIDVLLSAIAEKNEKGEVVRTLAVLLDVTERKRMEEQLQRARDELEGKVERQLLRRNPYGLTFRELTVLHLVAAGRSDKEIGVTLGISPLTAQKHISNILAKMGVTSRTEAAARAIREGLLK